MYLYSVLIIFNDSWLCLCLKRIIWFVWIKLLESLVLRYIKRINTKKQNESTSIIKVLFRVPTSITWHVTCIYWLVSCILFNSRSKIQIEMSPCYRCRAAECRQVLGVYGLWAGRDVYGATSATSQANAFWDLIRRTIQFNWLNWQQARWPACTCQTLSLMSLLYKIWFLVCCTYFFIFIFVLTSF